MFLEKARESTNILCLTALEKTPSPDLISALIQFTLNRRDTRIQFGSATRINAAGFGFSANGAE